MPKINAPTYGPVTVATAAADVVRAIDQIGRRGKLLDTLVHKTAVSCLYHMQQHGDVRLMSRLVQSMPRSARRKGLIRWIEDYAPLAQQIKATKTDVDIQLRRGRADAEFRLSDAALTPYWEHTPERAPQPMTVDKLVAMIDRQLTRAVNDDAIEDSLAEKAKAEVRALFGVA